MEERNYTGIQLIDRNDELCILYEKCNMQQATLRSGELEIARREEEIRLLDLQAYMYGCVCTHTCISVLTTGLPRTARCALLTAAGTYTYTYHYHHHHHHHHYPHHYHHHD